VTRPTALRRVFRPSVRADFMAALPGWIVARLLVIAAWTAGVVAVDHLQPRHTIQQTQGLFAWDAAFYRGIAEHGYRGEPHEALRFFPLYPVLTRALSLAFLGRTWIALLVVANVAALVFGALVHRIARYETGDDALARRAAWLAAVFPAAFVLVWGYAEALMLVAVAAAILSARRGQFWWAAGLAAAAGLCRPLGVLVALPIAVEAARVWRRKQRSDRVAACVAVAAAPLGMLSYLVWAGARFGDWRDPLRLQDDLRGDIVDPITRIVRGLGDLTGSERLGDGLHIPFAIVFIALAIVVGRRLPASYTLFTAAVLLVALSADNLNSVERYGLNAFPLVIAAAAVSSDERVDRAVTALCAAGFLALTVLAWTGAYVP
jgi:hypothetical protein